MMQAGKLDERDPNYCAVSSPALSTSRQLNSADRRRVMKDGFHRCATAAVSTSEPAVTGRGLVMDAHHVR
jgi:hypothetical protein